MTMTTLTRRALLRHAASAATTLMLVSCSSDKQAGRMCAAPDQLTDSQLSLRDSLQYTDATNDANQACGGCAYFHAQADRSACGTCQILSGPVSAQGHCTSWSPKK